MTSMLAAALELIDHGWSIIPCREVDMHGRGAKSPYTQNGFHDASSDPTIVTSWWTKFPNALIGIAIPKGIVVLDVDPRNGGSIERLEEVCGGVIPNTMITESGRNDGGRHYWFTTYAQDLKNPLRDRGIDVKEGGKGYVIAPPSLHPETGKPYRWLNLAPIAPIPPCLLTAIRPTRKVSTPYRPSTRLTAGNGGSLVRVMARAVEGQRNQTLFWCACRMAELEATGIPAPWDDLIEAALRVGLSEPEIKATIASSMRTVSRGDVA